MFLPRSNEQNARSNRLQKGIPIIFFSFLKYSFVLYGEVMQQNSEHCKTLWQMKALLIPMIWLRLSFPNSLRLHTYIKDISCVSMCMYAKKMQRILTYIYMLNDQCE